MKLVEAEAEALARGLGRVAVAPVVAVQAPADLDHLGREARASEADEADERRAAGDLHGPQAPAVLIDACLDSVGERVALLARQRRGEVAHRLGVRVQLGERLPVGVAPLPEDQALGAQSVRSARRTERATC